MKKRLNIEDVTNELKGGSAFFPSYETPKSPQQSPAASEQQTPTYQTNKYIPERTNAPTPARPNGRRIITRNSFETYEDQMESLRKLSFKEKMEGKQGSMSKMVRDAIDEYLEKKLQEH